MNQRSEYLTNCAEKQESMILEAERWLWAHPQTGFKEWQAHDYLRQKFNELGYETVCAGDIPGFYADVDTGKEGPVVCVIGELDALDIPGHPEAVDGVAHLCGHHGQGAALLGLAAVLKEEHALDGLCGKIRLMMVPAEELTQLEFREELRKAGKIRYFGGKTEFMARGHFDEVDLAMMVHQGEGNVVFDSWFGCNGCMVKKVQYKGKTAHAAANPNRGINAQYAAMLGMQACNNLRETFRDNEHTRFHPVMQGANCAVNNIPDEINIESYVRGKTLEGIKLENRKINRALAGAALSMGAGVEIKDWPGYAPTQLDKNFMQLAEKCCVEMVGEDKVRFSYDSWGCGSTDMGDLSCVMPCALFNTCGGYEGHAHAVDYRVTDARRLCIDSTKAQALVLDALLKEDAAQAKMILAEYQPRFASIRAYLESLNEIFLEKEAVQYDEAGHVTIDFFND